MLTQHELELMELLWQYPDGLTHVEMIEKAETRSWKDSTAHLLINGLLRKEMIDVVGKRPSGRRHSRIFAPIVTKFQYEQQQVADRMTNFDDKQLLHLVSAFVADKPISQEVRAELLQLLQEER